MMLAWLLLATIPMDAVTPRDAVCLIERNHFFNERCEPVFTQYIFFDWSGARHDVVAWRLEKEGYVFTERPPCVTWTEEGMVYQVRGKIWRETWSQTDEEVFEREILKKELRRGLFRRKE